MKKHNHLVLIQLHNSTVRMGRYTMNRELGPRMTHIDSFKLKEVKDTIN